jgi:hypothetical protein
MVTNRETTKGEGRPKRETNDGRLSRPVVWRERIGTEGKPAAGEFPQTPKCGGYPGLAAGHLGPILVTLVEGTVDSHRFERGIDDELGLHRVAPQVTFGGGQQQAGIEFAQHKPQVQIAVGDLGDRFATHFAKVTAITPRHA